MLGILQPAVPFDQQGAFAQQIHQDWLVPVETAGRTKILDEGLVVVMAVHTPAELVSAACLNSQNPQFLRGPVLILLI